jgi:RNA polymerase primary sigma factor
MTRTEVTDAQISAAQGGNRDAMWEIVEAFDPMLLSIIRSAAPRADAADVEDLLQEARAVLIQHVRDYNSDASSAALTSFVYKTVRRTVQEVHVSMTTALAVDPTTLLEIRRALWAAGGRIEEAWSIIAAEPNDKRRMSRERFTAGVEAMVSTDSLDAPAGGDDADGPGLTLSDVIADPTAALSDSAERRDYARWLLTQISPRQCLALRAFYGIGMTAMPDVDAADSMGVKPAALRRLRTDGYASARRAASLHAVLGANDFTPLAIAA